MIKGFLVLAIVFASVNLHAKMLVVSDIDDTLKQSHVLNRRDALGRAMLTNIPFLGMNGALLTLQYAQPDAKFIYLTNAIDKLMRALHAQFLASQSFPKGPLYLRASILDTNYKLTTLRSILKAETPDQVVLLGDNGERDIDVYDRIKAEFPQIHFRTYIHIVYSSNNSVEKGSRLIGDQVGFATAFDLMMQFQKDSLVAPAMAAALYDTYGPDFLNEVIPQSLGVSAIPPWMNCSDLQKVPPEIAGEALIVNSVRARILVRCGQTEFFIAE